MAFSENLRTARKEKNLSQEQLAELLSVSRQAVSKWESDDGYPESEKLIQIAKVLGISLDYLLLGGQTSNKDNCNALQNQCGTSADRKITIRSFDGSNLSSYNVFAIVKVGLAGKKSPECLLSGRENGVGTWVGNTILGWYATTEDAQKELDGINLAIQNGEMSYRLQFFANVKGRFNPKIVDGSATK